MNKKFIKPIFSAMLIVYTLTLASSLINTSTNSNLDINTSKLDEKLGELISLNETEQDIETNNEINVNIPVGFQNDSENENKTIVMISGTLVLTDLEVVNNNELMLSNGEVAQIEITPTTAAQIAITRLNVNGCSNENNCTIELTETNTQNQNETSAAYNVEVEKAYRVLGLFNAQGEVNAHVDTQTGNIVEINRPWWTIFSTEVRGDADYQASFDN